MMPTITCITLYIFMYMCLQTGVSVTHDKKWTLYPCNAYVHEHEHLIEAFLPEWTTVVCGQLLVVETGEYMHACMQGTYHFTNCGNEPVCLQCCERIVLLCASYGKEVTVVCTSQCATVSTHRQLQLQCT